MRYLLKFLALAVIACVLAIPVFPHQSGAAPARTAPAGETEDEIAEFAVVLDTAEKAIKKIEKDLAKKPGGGTAQEKAIKREAQERLRWSRDSARQAADLKRQAKKARNKAERNYYLERARKKRVEARRHAEIITGGSQPRAPAVKKTGKRKTASSNTPPGGKIKKLKFGFGGVRQQLEEAEKRSVAAAKTSNIDQMQKKAEILVGAGRAGGGGVSLHVAAVIKGVNPKAVASSTIQDGRLVLIMRDGKRIQFPPMLLDHLAIAIRSVQGGEGTIRGPLLANGREVIVISTGKERYGELAWRKSNLPNQIKGAKIGKPFSLAIGPGLGLLSIAEPSMDRVTYYGPIHGNDVGRILLQSDQTIAKLSKGMDRSTGKPVHPIWKPIKITNPVTGKIENLPGIKGFPLVIVMYARQALAKKLAEEKAAKDKKKKVAKKKPSRKGKAKKPKWWDVAGWYVWTTGEIGLARAKDGNSLKFTKATMKLTIWSEEKGRYTKPGAVTPKFVAAVTRHYDYIAKIYPVLAELREVAKTVAVVRWMKKYNIPADLAWAKAYAVKQVDTPDTVRDMAIYTAYSSGKPVFVQ